MMHGQKNIKLCEMLFGIYISKEPRPPLCAAEGWSVWRTEILLLLKTEHWRG